MDDPDHLSVQPAAIKERFGMKAAVHKLVGALGYEIRRKGEPDMQSLVNRAEAPAGELAAMLEDRDRELTDARTKFHECQVMRDVRLQDGVEIEGLLRLTALPDLPPRQGRQKQLSQLIGTTVSEGLYVVDALHKALRIAGDICEFGVAQGATSQLIAAELLDTDRNFGCSTRSRGCPRRPRRTA